MGLRVERQLDLSSVAARLRGRPVCLSGLVAGVASQATRPEFVERQLDLSSVAARLRGRLVRESRRLPNRLLVPGRTVSEQGLRHLQQCNFLSLFTSGYAPGSVVQVYGFS
ncbi:hypothetical protein Taro_026560 [Colocasia esculenta]|uniref:Uncharacterized protein n=1 Tax=Colocasia esculenta TaxID=4460 RepID=A0A843VFJ9_COLES|nr:hypothetical protein [Colocasia esculenta]